MPITRNFTAAVVAILAGGTSFAEGKGNIRSGSFYDERSLQDTGGTLPPAPGGGGGDAPPGGGGGGGGRGDTSCTGLSTNPSVVGLPGRTDLCIDVVLDQTIVYPDNFNILNEVAHYECPDSGIRVIVSNGIPDHDIMIGNPNPPCVQNWYSQFPLEPTYNGDGSVTEPSVQGFIGMALNGVPIFGAQEGGGSNAVENVDGSLRVPYFGHASPNGDWHYHSGEFGQTVDLELGELTSQDLLGYAVDGFTIYGPLDDPSVLDECNGIQMGDTPDTYQYHVRVLADVDETAIYCNNGESPVVTWNYILGCVKGDVSSSSVSDGAVTVVPSDCVLVSGTVAEKTTDDGEQDNSTSNFGSSSSIARPSILGGLLGAIGVIILGNIVSLGV